MPTVCAAYNCKHRSNKTTDISYFKFPWKNKLLTEKWIIAMRRENWFPTQHTRLCSFHFEDKFMYKVNNQRRLYYSAVPTIFDFSKNNAQRGLRAKRLSNEKCLEEACAIVNTSKAFLTSTACYMQYKDLLEENTCKKSGDFINAAYLNPWEHDHGLYPKQSRTHLDEVSEGVQYAGPVHSPDSWVSDMGSDLGSYTDKAQSQLQWQRLQGSSQCSSADIGHSERAARKRDWSTMDDGEGERGCSQKRSAVCDPHLEDVQRPSRLHSDHSFPDEPVDVYDMLDIKEEPFPEEELPMESTHIEENIEQRQNMCTTLLNADCYSTVKIKQEEEEEEEGYPITVKYEMIDSWLVAEAGMQ